MEGIEDRHFDMIECLGFCIPGQDPITFVTRSGGNIAAYALGEGSTIDRA